MLVDSGLAFIASTREHPASQALGWFMGLLGLLFSFFIFLFLFLVFVITVLLRVKGKKRFKQRCDAWRCRVFPAAFKARKVSNKGVARGGAGFSLPRSRSEKLKQKYGAYWCRVFPARAASTAGFSLPVSKLLGPVILYKEGYALFTKIGLGYCASLCFIF